MSGLAALFHRDGRPVSAGALRAMLDAVPYRGPDGAWLRTWETAGLGFAKLAVTPEEEHERQPLVSPRTGCAVVADVRLDNRSELLAALPDRPPASASDAELILRAYEAWGDDAPARLLGDFAFVLLDPRRRRLLGARDASGQRSLFYRDSGRTFAAASEMHQLLQDPSVLLEPDEGRIRDFLVPLNMLRNEKERADTYYAGIRSLLPGHLLIVDQAGLAVRRYWELTALSGLRYRRDEEYVEHFRSLFFEAVRARLRTSRPMGAMLSGGLDSSSVVCVAQELLRRREAEPVPFRAYSLVFDALECDERPLIQDIGDKYGFPTDFVPPWGFYEWLQLEPKGFRQSPALGLGERDALFRVASAAGVRPMLSGDVADACIRGSMFTLDSLFRQGRWGALQRHLRAYLGATGESLPKTLLLTLLGPLLPLSLQRALMVAYSRRHVELERWRLTPRWMPEGLRRELGDRHLELCLDVERNRRFGNESRHQEYLNLSPIELALNPTGWPVENWRPFADRRLHQFLLAVPPEVKFEPQADPSNYYGGSKRLLRRALTGVLPESIRTRTQPTHFASLFQDDLRRKWASYTEAFGPASQPEIASRGYVERDLFWTRLVAMRDGAVEGDFTYVMRLVGLESWFRTFRLARGTQVTFPSLYPSVRVATGRDGYPSVGADGAAGALVGAAASGR